MSNKDHDSVLAAFRAFLPALVRLAMRSGINGRVLSELVKESYVAVVTNDFGKSGRQTNVSRTVMLTGLSRKDVVHYRELNEQDSSVRDADRRRYGLGTLMRDWYTNTAYRDADGTPIGIPIEGKEDSFASMARKYFSDIPASSILRELVDAGVAKKLENRKVIPLKDYFYPPAMNADHVKRMGGVMEDFLNTMEHNLNRNPEDASRVEIRTIEESVASQHEATFRKLLDSEATRLYQRVERWLQDKRDFETSDEDDCTRIGFGVYQIGEK